MGRVTNYTEPEGNNVMTNLKTRWHCCMEVKL